MLDPFANLTVILDFFFVFYIYICDILSPPSCHNAPILLLNLSGWPMLPLSQICHVSVMLSCWIDQPNQINPIITLNPSIYHGESILMAFLILPAIRTHLFISLFFMIYYISTYHLLNEASSIHSLMLMRWSWVSIAWLIDIFNVIAIGLLSVWL